jgi:hypothetical protein
VDYAAPSEIGGAIAQLSGQRAQALVVPSDHFAWDHRFEIFDAARKHSLPTMADDDAMAREAGALISYTSSQLNWTGCAPSTSTASFAGQNLPIYLSDSPRSSCW